MKVRPSVVVEGFLLLVEDKLLLWMREAAEEARTK
jgi:hypothetical protein